jgi:hypothetical protein
MMAGFASPFLGWAGLRFIERFDAVVGATRALALWGMGRERFLQLQVGRRRLRADIVALSEEVAARSGPQATGSSNG